MLKSIENELKEIEAALDSLQANVKKEKVLLEQGEVRTYTCFLKEDKEKVGGFLGVVEAIFSLLLCCGVGIVLPACHILVTVPIYNTSKL